MNKHPEKIKLTVVNRYLNGEQISKITRDINISRTTAYAWIKQHNNSFNKGKAPNFRYLHDLEQKCERQQILSRYSNVLHAVQARHYQKDTK